MPSRLAVASIAARMPESSDRLAFTDRPSLRTRVTLPRVAPAAKSSANRASARIASGERGSGMARPRALAISTH